MLSRETQSGPRIDWRLRLLIAAACIVVPRLALAQGTTGALIGTVTDAQGGVLPGAVAQVTSPALIGGPATTTTNEKGQLRFPTLPPGAYALQIELSGFATLHEEDVRIGAGATIERTVVLKLAELSESVTVEGTGSRIEVRNPGFGTRFGLQDLQAIPTRRASMFDFIRATPGISPTSAASGTVTTISAFGSGTNENQFLIDGTNFTCPCNGVARAEAGVDFIQEVQVQSVGASAEFGNFQGAVINIVLKQGGNRFLYDAAYFAQTSGLTSQPSRISIPPGSATTSGYERTTYRDLTSSLGGAVVRDRVWFFGGYQYLRDADSQPGTVPTLPRRLASEKYFGKLTWQPAPGWQLVHSFHDEHQDNFDQPTIILPFEATLHRTASVPATAFGQLTHTSSSNTVWNVIVGRFVFAQESAPSNGIRTTPSRTDNATNVTSGAPSQFSTLTIVRTNAKATVSHYRTGLWGGDHELKAGGQFERAGHHSINVIPTGVRFTDRSGQPFQATSADPGHGGGEFVTTSGFVMDNVRFGRTTVSAGLRVDHNRAISQDLSGVDLNGRETDVIVEGLGTMYSWTLWSPRLGLTTKLSADGRTIVRASYGRFSQGVMTGELEPFHPGTSTLTTAAYSAAAGTYSTIVRQVGPRDLQLDPGLRAPHTDEYSVGVDRELRRDLAVAVAYVGKTGDDFIGWIDVAGQYAQTTALLPDGRSVPIWTLTSKPLDRRYQLTNPNEYSLTYNGLVSVIEKRRSHGWQALGSYTFSKAHGLQTSSGATAAGAQVSTVSPPQPSTFGQDPNDLTNALGRLPNDRPHIFRVMGAVDVPWGGFSVAANLQHFSGKPWAATATNVIPQEPQRRMLLEPRGARRLSSQTLLDLRVSKTVRVGGLGTIDLLLDVFNTLNETAEESIASDVLVSATFGQPSTFVDPRRAMLGVRMHLGR